MSQHYEVEINVARKDTPRIWRTIIDSDGESATWETKDEAVAYIRDSGKSELRLIAVTATERLVVRM